MFYITLYSVCSIVCKLLWFHRVLYSLVRKQIQINRIIILLKKLKQWTNWTCILSVIYLFRCPIINYCWIKLHVSSVFYIYCIYINVWIHLWNELTKIRYLNVSWSKCNSHIVFTLSLNESTNYENYRLNHT